MPTGRSPEGPLRSAAGRLCVALLRGARRLPPALIDAPLRALLPLYPALRPRQALRLRSLFAAFGSAAPPGAPVPTVPGYYRRRLELLLHGLRRHGRELTPGEPRVEGEAHWLEALGIGRPVVLVGLHLGPVELLHRTPPVQPGRPFHILTAEGFAAPLTAWMAEGRTREGKSVVFNRAQGRLALGPRALGPALIPVLRATLRERGVLAVMADQVPGSASDRISLWGSVETPWPSGLLAWLARRGCVLLPVSTRMEGGSAVFRYHPIWDFGGVDGGPAGDGRGAQVAPGRAGGDDALRPALEGRMRAFLESTVAEAPDQWNWSYPGIRCSPPTKAAPLPESTRPYL